MVLLATAATIIASQAVITGAFSVASQAARVGYLPRLRVIHTSAAREGQIYVPWINGLLLVAVLTLVLTFRSSERLAYAYRHGRDGDHHDHAIAVPVLRPYQVGCRHSGW